VPCDVPVASANVRLSPSRSLPVTVPSTGVSSGVLLLP
jgi:hypothetical protein